MKTLNAGLCLALCFTLGTAIGRASLGDTEAQCVAKYGPEFDVQEKLGFDAVGDRAASFNLKTPAYTVVVNVTFLNGVASLERITNADSAVALSEAQKKAILDSESAGLTWSKTDSINRADVAIGTQRWLRSDGATAACWASSKPQDRSWNEIDIATKRYADAQRSVDRDSGR